MSQPPSSPPSAAARTSATEALSARSRGACLRRGKRRWCPGCQLGQVRPQRHAWGPRQQLAPRQETLRRRLPCWRPRCPPSNAGELRRRFGRAERSVVCGAERCPRPAEHALQSRDLRRCLRPRCGWAGGALPHAPLHGEELRGRGAFVASNGAATHAGIVARVADKPAAAMLGRRRRMRGALRRHRARTRVCNITVRQVGNRLAKRCNGGG